MTKKSNKKNNVIKINTNRKETKMKMSNELEKKLKRLYELNCLFKVDGDYCDESYFEEYHELKDEVMEAVGPALEMIVNAGLLSVYIPLDKEDVEKIQNQKNLCGLGVDDIESVCENGNFQLNAGDVSSISKSDELVEFESNPELVEKYGSYREWKKATENQ